MKKPPPESHDQPHRTADYRRRAASQGGEVSADKQMVELFDFAVDHGLVVTRATRTTADPIADE